MTSRAEMSRAEMLHQVGEIARRELRREDDGELREEQRLVEDLRLDSIELLTLATAVEDHFRVRLDEDDESSLETVGDLVSVIRRKLRRRDEDDPDRREP